MDKEVKVLILTASFGTEHNSVARAIREQILSCDNSTIVIIKDLFEITNPRTNQLMYKAYKNLITNHSNIYNHFYNQKKNQPYTLPDEIVYRINSRKFTEYILLLKPSIIVSTFPVCSGMVSRFKEKHNQNVPLVTCITDVVDSIEWVHDYTDIYFAQVEEVKRCLVCRGVQEQKIKVTGLNRRLYNRLTRGNEFKKIIVYGYLENVAEHMDNADILISKSGGITIFEAMHKNVPIVVNQSTIG